MYPYPKHVWSPAGGWWPYPKKCVTACAHSLYVAFPLFLFAGNEFEAEAVT